MASSTHNNGDESTKLAGGDDHDAAVKKFEEDTMIHISKHPVLSHKITILRSSATPCGTFRAALKEITYHLGYEATMDLTTIPVDISVPDQQDPRKHCDFQGSKLKENIALVPILRSGLCMVDSMLELLPNAAVHHIGMYKAKHDQLPVQYYNRLPRQCRADIAFVLDTLIATSTTISCVISTLKKWGVPRIHVISVVCSEQGLKALREQHPDVWITVACVDAINADGALWPGLGDSGDRLFGTAPFVDDQHDHEALVHPSRRKRSLSQG